MQNQKIHHLWNNRWKKSSVALFSDKKKYRQGIKYNEKSSYRAHYRICWFKLTSQIKFDDFITLKYSRYKK